MASRDARWRAETRKRPEFARRGLLRERIMRGLAIKLLAIAISLVALTSERSTSLAQAPAPGIGFRNELKFSVIVQGWSIVNNMPRRGQPLLIPPGRTVWDNNLPLGPRYYSVYDANQPSKVLLRDQPVIVGNADQLYAIRPSPTNPNRVVLGPLAIALAP